MNNSVIKECLSGIIGKDVSSDIVDYVLSMTNAEDYDEFMENLVDTHNAKHRQLYDKLKQELFGRPKSSNQHKELNKGRNDKKITNQPKEQQSSSGKGKKIKYTSFYGRDNKPGLLKGRHPCNCQATKHELINNCIKCGRIVCEQEGSGPCFFCDTMVVTRYEMELLNSNTKESDKLYNQLMEQKKSKEWKRAIESRNKLLDVDKLGAIKNVVYDDQNDYFDMDSKWASKGEKDSATKRYLAHHNALHRSRKDLKIALDFASRTVTFQNDEDIKHKENLLKGVNKFLDSSDRKFPEHLFDGDKGALIKNIVQLMEKSSMNTKTDVKKNVDKKVINNFRAANNDFLEAVDQGLCLSMHQPWASLLIAGIKLHEGRTWSTEHRGRLWIAAAAKEPDDDVILDCEQLYRSLYEDPALEFPKKYPTSCLLGCVTVDDCLPQEEYRNKFPNGESESPHVFICSNPVILPVFYPIQGSHKIFALPKELHKTAKAALMSSKWL